MYRAKAVLDEESLLVLYYSYIHSYLNYANSAWVALIEESEKTTQSIKIRYLNRP